MVIIYLKSIFQKDKRYGIGDKVSNYKIEKIIGQGRFGIVYLAINELNEKVVIKQLKKNMLKKSKDKLKYEKEILTKLNDKRFPKFIVQFKDKDKIGYILEYKEGKTFDEIIYKDKVIFQKNEIYNVASELVNIIKTLYENNIIHKDIRVSNVIQQENKEVVLIDFGLARYINDFKYKKEEDFWYLADFLIHLHYTSYNQKSITDKPWYEELSLIKDEEKFLKKLMGLDGEHSNIYEVENELNKIKLNL
ncbi:protein kinase family protein [Romboutsia sp.]|uniref:protein kinase family protein n=1 Tax=Romboutsia sp. TaxID=1965302 RepID=UPI003F3E6C4B